jgi:hypothetical protein
LGAAVSALEQARLEKAREIGGAAMKGCGNPVNATLVLEGAWDGHISVASALAALTEANWQPPVDPDLLIAREAVADIACRAGYPESRGKYEDGFRDNWSEVRSALAAVKLFKARQS